MESPLRNDAVPSINNARTFVNQKRNNIVNDVAFTSILDVSFRKIINRCQPINTISTLERVVMALVQIVDQTLRRRAKKLIMNRPASNSA